MSTRIFRIENLTSGHVFGLYTGTDRGNALDTLALDAGYLSWAEAANYQSVEDDDILVTDVTDTVTVYVDGNDLHSYDTGDIIRPATAAERAASEAAGPTGAFCLGDVRA